MEGEEKRQRKRNPREKANPISAVFFFYMFPVFYRNYRNGLTEEDLFEPLEEHKSSRLGSTLEKLWRKESKKHKKTALHRALFKQFRAELFAIGLVKVIHVLEPIIVLPIAIKGLVSYFRQDSEVTRDAAYLYAGLVLMSILLEGLLNHPSMMAMMHVCMKMRVACCSLIYRKTLTLSHAALNQTTVGQIVNLLSNDVSKFDQGFIFLHLLVLSPLQAAVALYMLYIVVGNSAFPGMGFLLTFVPFQVFLGTRASSIRLSTALRTDERVRLMNEILNGIQVIKMYTWEKPFAKLVSLARRQEVKSIRHYFLLLSLLFCFEMFIARVSIFITIIMFVRSGHFLTAEIAFYVTAVYTVMRPYVTMLFSVGVSSTSEVYISVSRIQKFLSYEEVAVMQSDDETEVKNPKISIKNVSAKWSPDLPENTLTDINLNIAKRQLVALVGPVGSGKSSLVNVILKELTITAGTLEVVGKIAYASQEIWIFAASVRQNILFGDVYNVDRYKQVIKVCCLEADLASFPHGDRTIVGEKGKSLSGGQKARINLARCIYRQADIYLLDDPLSAVDAKVGSQLYDNCIKGFLKDKICILVTHQLQYLKNAERILILSGGKILADGNFNKLQTTGLDFANLLKEFQSDEEEADKKRKSVHAPEMEVKTLIEKSREAFHVGNVTAETYLGYFRAGGNCCVAFLLIFAFMAAQAIASGGDYYVARWVNLEQRNQEARHDNRTLPENIDKKTVTYTYAAITCSTIAISVGLAVFFSFFFMRASVNLHTAIFENVSATTMRFFNTNPTGRILNRFSTDIGLIDEYIPLVLYDVVKVGLLLLSTLILTSVINPWLLIPSAVLLICFYFMRNVYLETSRSVKRIEAITRSPIFNHITATMQGLSTIRSFQAQETLIKEFDSHQDRHSSAWYIFLASNRAFGFWIDMICTVFVSVAALHVISFKHDFYGGDVGLIITQYMGLTEMLQWGLRQWSELENVMTSVERVLEYTELPSEPIRPEAKHLPADWPRHGKITFKDVSMRYTPNHPPIIWGLNFTIHAKEKIGIAGRTGAGKSSMIAALFQLYIVEGAIFVDEVNTLKVPLNILRSKISIIPQEPVLFSGTMRKNLDPFEEYDDDTIWKALEQVELRTVISELPSGLNAAVAESGTNFSVGQRQLVCLARAIIRSNKILVMDEATANVDPQTDSFIQKTIRTRFADCTVLTIAHRLHTIMDSDKILVMDAGRMVEFDHPYQLLQNPRGFFSSMVQTTGKNISKNLYDIAEEHYKKKAEEPTKSKSSQKLREAKGASSSKTASPKPPPKTGTRRSSPQPGSSSKPPPKKK